MLRVVSAISGAGLVLASYGIFASAMSSNYGADEYDAMAIAATFVGGISTLIYALRPNATKSDRLISTWMELKTAELRARIDALDSQSRGDDP